MAAEARIFHYGRRSVWPVVALVEGLTYGDESPATDEGSKQLATADIDVSGGKGHEVVGCADRVG